MASGFLKGGIGFLKGSAGEMIKGGSSVSREIRVGVTHVSELLFLFLHQNLGCLYQGVLFSEMCYIALQWF